MKNLSYRRTGKTVGVLVLLTIVFSAMSAVPYTLVVPGDPAATAIQLKESETLYRLSIVAEIMVPLIEIALAAAIYFLLKPVNHLLSLTAAFARFAMAVFQGFNVVIHLFIPQLLGDPDISIFEIEKIQAAGMLLMKTPEIVIHIWGLFFGLNLLLIGILVYKSGYIPRIIGILLITASMAYFGADIGYIINPSAKELLNWVGYLGILEIAFPLWLLIWGVNDEKVTKVGEPQSTVII